VTDTTLIERAKEALKIVGDDTWSLTPQETYDGRSTTLYYRVMDQNLNAICCEEYGAHCDGGAKKMHLIALAPDLARALIREREARERLARALDEMLDHVFQESFARGMGEIEDADEGPAVARARETLTAYRKAQEETDNDK